MVLWLLYYEIKTKFSNEYIFCCICGKPSCLNHSMLQKTLNKLKWSKWSFHWSTPYTGFNQREHFTSKVLLVPPSLWNCGHNSWSKQKLDAHSHQNRHKLKSASGLWDKIPFTIPKIYTIFDSLLSGQIDTLTPQKVK